jgi:uroporphyrinogen-III synthase
MSERAVPEADRLRGLGVVVTRPLGQAEALCRMIEAAGGRAIRMPLLGIEPLGADSAGAAKLRGLSKADWLIFVSANAVRHGLEHVPGALLAGSARAKVVAIGAATRGELEARGVTVDLAPKAQFNSETLLAMPELAEISGQTMVIVRGMGGREVLAETLGARGAEVEYAEVYRRYRPAFDAARLLAQMRAGAMDAILVTSGEALDHLVNELGEAGLVEMASTPLVVVSDRVAQRARGLGFRQVAVAASASDQALFDAIADVGPRLRGYHPISILRGYSIG